MSNSSNIRRYRPRQGIVSIAVKGYKSLVERCSLEVRPLTILAGANSSGKSSIMQPLLMLKQTLEATYDPGALLLNGPNVKYTSTDQLFSRITGRPTVSSFSIYVKFDDDQDFETVFSRKPKKGIEISSSTYTNDAGKDISLRFGMTQEDIQAVAPKTMLEFRKVFSKGDDDEFEWNIERSRCFLSINLKPVNRTQRDRKSISFSSINFPAIDEYSLHIRNIIHVPGLRGNPERTYKTTAIGSAFPGTFDDYVASVISYWQTTEDGRLKRLSTALETLGLTWKVEAKQVDDTQVELRVGRTLHSQRGGAKDTVNIADVGFGVSQTLPILVALLAAERNQLVYIEQPEIHLHPRAQVAMASILCEAANRGVRVVVETHSSLLLRGIQTQVARDTTSAESVKLHWFKRNAEDGVTEISSASLDKEGAFGDWPEDFDDVALNSEREYLDAAEMKAYK